MSQDLPSHGERPGEMSSGSSSPRTLLCGPQRNGRRLLDYWSKHGQTDFHSLLFLFGPGLHPGDNVVPEIGQGLRLSSVSLSLSPFALWIRDQWNNLCLIFFASCWQNCFKPLTQEIGWTTAVGSVGSQKPAAPTIWVLLKAHLGVLQADFWRGP